MCFNVAVTAKKADLKKRFKAVLPTNIEQNALAELPTNYFVSGFTHPLLPIIKQDGLFHFEWGLIPHWTKDAANAKSMSNMTLNAVGETVFEKPSFKNAILSQRCILGINGFFEWQDVNGTKFPYFIHLKSNDIFALGCVFDNWVDNQTKTIKSTFSILTTPANPLMEKIHNVKKRMPLILSPEDEAAWLNPDLTQNEVAALIRPYNTDDMSAYTISKKVNHAKDNRNIQEILDKVIYPELEQINNNKPLTLF